MPAASGRRPSDRTQRSAPSRRTPRPSRSSRPGSVDETRVTHGDTPYARIAVDDWARLFSEIAGADEDFPTAVDDQFASYGLDEVDLDLPAATKVTDDTVAHCIAFIERTEIVPFFDSAIQARKIKPGRPNRFTVLSVLVALWWCATEGKPLHLREVARFLTERISPEMQKRLGVTATTARVPLAARTKVSTAAATGTGQSYAYTDLNAAARAIGSLFATMLSHCDPSVLPKNRRLTHADLAASKRDVPDETRIRMQANLDWVCNQILYTSWLYAPRSVRRYYRKHPSACVDATPIRVPAALENGRYASSDPDAGAYKRYSQMNPDKITKFMQAYDAHLIVAGDDTPGDKQRVPGLVLAMTTDRPGVDPSGSTRRLLAALDHHGLTPRALGATGYLAGDRLYTGQAAESFQIVARQFGYGLVLDYRDDQLGIQATHPGGAILVEGAWYCPSLPSDLVNATKDYRAKKINTEVYLSRIVMRQTYRMRVKEVDGLDKRMRCPADTPSPVVACPLKATSMTDRPTRQADGNRVDVRITVRPRGDAFKDGVIPSVCSSKSAVYTAEQAAKYEQALPYGSEEQRTLFSALRSTQEGAHGFAKDEAQTALGNPGRRRVRGKAPQALFTAFLLAASNLRKVRSFVEQSVTDEATATAYVIKKQQVRPNRWFMADTDADAIRPPDPGGPPPPAAATAGAAA